MGARLERFPLFPLGLVALPHELVPLHIFEDRYQAMIELCLDEGLEFGIVWAGDDGLHETGCAVAIERVLRRFDDGRLDILTRGTRPIRLAGDLADIPYPAATVELIADDGPEPEGPAIDDAHQAYAALVEDVTDEPPEPGRLAEMDAYAMAATVELGLEAKQQLLDLRSENARLALLARLLRGAQKRLDFVDRAQAAARSNGKIRFG